MLGGSSTTSSGACWRGEREIFESLGYSKAMAQAAFEWLEPQLCAPVADNQYNLAFNSSWDSLGIDYASGAGLASWANTSSSTVYQRARSLFSGGVRRTAPFTFEKGLMASSRSSLTVMTHTTAKRILLDDRSPSHDYQSVPCDDTSRSKTRS